MVTMKYRYFQRILNVFFFFNHGKHTYIYIDIHIYNTQKKVELEFLANFGVPFLFPVPGLERGRRNQKSLA